jgi:hypothetical protein
MEVKKIIEERLCKISAAPKIFTVEDARNFISAICDQHPEIAVTLPLPPSVVTKNKRKLKIALRTLNDKRVEMGLAPQRLIDTWESECIIAYQDPKTTERQRQELSIWRDIKFKIEEEDDDDYNGPSVADILRDSEGLPPLVLSDTISESKCQIEDHSLESSLDVTK